MLWSMGVTVDQLTDRLIDRLHAFLVESIYFIFGGVEYWPGYRSSVKSTIRGRVSVYISVEPPRPRWVPTRRDRVGTARAIYYP